jgi:hypothetical protein
LKLCVVVHQQKFMNCCRKCVVPHNWITLWHNSCLSQRSCQGQDSIEDKEHSGRLRTCTDNSMVVIIATILERDRCMTCEEIAMESRIPISPIHHVLTEVEGHYPPHDNARPHITQSVKTVFTDYKCKALSHTASPCLQSQNKPSWFQSLCGRWLQSVETVHAAIFWCTRQLKAGGQSNGTQKLPGLSEAVIRHESDCIGGFYASKIFLKIKNCCVLLLDNSMQQSTSWEANSSSASQEFPCILWNLEVHNHLPRVLCWDRCTQPLPSHPVSLTHIIMLSCHLWQGIPSCLFLLKHCVDFCSVCSYAICTAHLILFYLIALIIFHDWYQSCSSSQCGFLLSARPIYIYIYICLSTHSLSALTVGSLRGQAVASRLCSLT